MCPENKSKINNTAKHKHIVLKAYEWNISCERSAVLRARRLFYVDF